MGVENDEVSRQLASIYRCRKQIVTDLDCQDILTELLAHLVIDHRDKQYIDHEKSLEDKAEKLLTILEEHSTKEDRNPYIIYVFINSLKTKYNWLYKRLTEDVPDSRVIPLPSGSSIVNKHLDNVIKEELVFESLDERKVKMLLELGGVQCLPGVTVERTASLELIRSELVTLKRNRFLVIAGMAGCGKSVLATQAVSNSSLLIETYPDGVYWLAIGKDCSEAKDALLSKMRILCEKLGVAQAPNSFDHGADLLRTAFLSKPNALLILDDVWRSEVIRAFDVGCRILITTRDLSVMDVVNSRFTHIKISDGFTEDESLELFSQALKIEATKLPDEAKSIHSECKGSPMVISLISSLLQEHEASDTGRWQYYLEFLSKRKYSKMRRIRSYEHSSIVDAISLSIEGLSPERKKLYMDFALFQDDVGIPCSVLITLWSMQKYEVEDVMKEFVRKSLAIEEYDHQKKCYVYSIHNLLLNYLKYQLLSENNLEKDSHAKLIERYLDVCNGEFNKLPDDGYIYFYLGYHLYKSKMYHYFPKIYLDLKFIGEKLRITGTADLLVDIRKYLDFIVGDDEEKLKTVEEIQTFAQLVGHRIYGQLDLDVIQVALQTPHLQRIHAQAKTLAQIAGNRLYLEWKNAKSGQWKHPESTVLCHDHVTCVKFVGAGGSHFICGLSNGCIQLCDLESSAVCHNFRGHSDSIQSLQVYPSTNPLQCANGMYSQNGDSGDTRHLFILSGSMDKTCKLWNLKNVLKEVESKPFELRPGRLLGTSPSPKLRPDQWAFDNEKDDSFLTFELHTAPVSYAQFCLDGFKIVSTSTNEIMIWSPSNGQILSKISLTFDLYPNLTLQRCLFPPELSPSYLLCSAENQVILLSAESASIYSGVEAHLTRIVEILFISQNSFCTVGENEIGIWKVMKYSSKAKAFRSRSLSPSRCLAMGIGRTEADSVKIRPSAKTLDPKDIQVDWECSNKNGEESTELGSPASKSLDMDCDASVKGNGTSSVFIHDRNGIIQIVKEDTLPSHKSRSFLCASFACSYDGRMPLLACGTADHKIVLWRLDSRECLGSFTSHNGWVTALDFSCVDICTLLSGSEDHTVMVWDIEAEEKGTKEPQKNMKFSSSFVPGHFDQGHFISLFSTEKNTLQIHKDSKKLFETEAVEHSVTCICVSEKGTFGAIGTSNGDILYIPIDSILSENQGKPANNFMTYIESLNSSITCLSFGVSNQFLAAGCNDGTFLVLKDFSIIQKFNISKHGIINIDFINDNHVVAIAQDSSTMIIHLTDSKIVQTWKSQTDVHITSSELRSFENGPIIALGTSDHGVSLLTLTNDLVSVRETCLDARATSPVRSLAINTGGTKLAIGYDNGIISIWNLDGELPKKDMDLVLHKSWVQSLKFSADSVGNIQWLVSCSDKIAFWSLDKQIEIKPRRSSFMAERRRRRSGGESPVRNRLSLEIPVGNKIGRQGKRELLQQFSFRGNYAQCFFNDPYCEKVVTVDDTGVFYLLEMLKSEPQNPLSAKI